MFKKRSAQGEPVLPVITTPPWTAGPPGAGCADTDAPASAEPAFTPARGPALGGAGEGSSARAAPAVASTKERARTALRLTSARPSGRLLGHPARIIRCASPAGRPKQRVGRSRPRPPGRPNTGSRRKSGRAPARRGRPRAPRSGAGGTPPTL